MSDQMAVARDKLRDRSATTGGGCIEWRGCISPRGYGHVKLSGRLWTAHRLAWTAHHGPIPGGMNVLHCCDNRSCVNLAHMYLGTIAENNQDRDRRGRAAPPSPKDRFREGAQHRNAKLTESAVLAIRADTRQHVSIAKAYSVSPTTVANVKKRIAWRCVP